MEKKEIQEWRDRLIKMFGIYHSDGQEYITCPLCGINLDELAKHMIEELDKAREEGNEELSEAMIKYLENMIVLVGAFNPMSEVIKARQEGELEAYKGILSKLKQ